MSFHGFSIPASVRLYGAVGDGVGGDRCRADRGLLPVQLQLVARTIASQLPGERLDAIGRHRPGVDPGEPRLTAVASWLKRVSVNRQHLPQLLRGDTQAQNTGFPGQIQGPPGTQTASIVQRRKSHNGLAPRASFPLGPRQEGDRTWTQISSVVHLGTSLS